MSWIYFPSKERGAGRMGEGTWYTKTEAKSKLLDFGNGYTVVVINSGKTTGNSWDEKAKINRDRQEAQRDVINPGDEEQYKKIAAANLKRYKDLVAQIKLTRKKEDDTAGYDKIIDDYEKINTRIIKLTRAITKDPKAYNKYDIQNFFTWVRDERRYNSNYKPWTKNPGSQYYGSNGLNYVFKCFIDAYMACFGSGYYKDTPDESDYKSLENAAAAMKKVMEIADEKLKKFGV